MIKFLYFTDSHIRGTTPSSRKDDYRKALFDKFRQMGEIITKHKPQYVLCGGDLLHQPEVSYSVLNEFLDILKNFWYYRGPLGEPKNPFFYSVVGSHDKIGYNPDSIFRGAFGTLVGTDKLRVLEDGGRRSIFLDETENLCTQVSGVSHEFGNDIDPDRYFIPKGTGVFKMIQICHGPVVKDPQRFPHICTKDIKTEADVVLCGHIHDGFPTHKIGNTIFANPGSLGRIENTDANRNRIPTVLLIEISKDKSTITEIPLNCRKGDEIFIDKEQDSGVDITEFLTHLKDTVTNIEDLSYKEIVARLGEELQVEKEVVEKSIEVLDGVKSYEF